jgi:hypothetical protein
MGQEHSQSSLHLERSTSSKHTHNFSGSKVRSIPKPKSIIIQIDSDEFTVEVPEDTLTCGWLLSEAIRRYEGEKELIALKSLKNLETLDCWLMQFDRTLQPLRSKETLQAVFKGKSLKPGPKAFVPVKFIGKGAFSHVVEVRKKDTGELFAVKILKKQQLINEGKIEQIFIERNILKKSENCFINKLHFAYQTVRFK